jgi:hypothetical protein
MFFVGFKDPPQDIFGDAETARSVIAQLRCVVFGPRSAFIISGMPLLSLRRTI